MIGYDQALISNGISLAESVRLAARRRRRSRI